MFASSQRTSVVLVPLKSLIHRSIDAEDRPNHLHCRFEHVCGRLWQASGRAFFCVLERHERFKNAILLIRKTVAESGISLCLRRICARSNFENFECKAIEFKW